MLRLALAAQYQIDRREQTSGAALLLPLAVGACLLVIAAARQLIG